MQPSRAPVTAGVAVLLLTTLIVCLRLAVALPSPADESPGSQTFNYHQELSELNKKIFTSFLSPYMEDIGMKKAIYSGKEMKKLNKDLHVNRKKRHSSNNVNHTSETTTLSSASRNNYMYTELPPNVDFSKSESSDKPTEKMVPSLPIEDVAGMSQHFFPSFTPLFQPPSPLNPSHPYLFQEQAHSNRPQLLRQPNIFQPLAFGGPVHEHKYVPAPAIALTTKSNGVLGSGNFGVIRGGTFYGDARGDASEYNSGEAHNIYGPFYRNGHGRPEFFNGASNPRPQHHGNDFFANFRDFADINTPAKASFSESYVVYVNKNKTISMLNNKSNNIQPKNIIEKLSIIDGANKHNILHSQTHSTKTTKKHNKKTLPFKRKYSKLGIEKSRQSKFNTHSSSKGFQEPLIALS